MDADAFSKLASLSSIDLKRSVMIKISVERSVDAIQSEVNVIDQHKEYYD